jgi:UDP-N-acetylglucosamine 2-epimerase (non-hydrolysing)
MRTRVTTVLGTRPEMIRLSSIISKLDNAFDHRLINTSQNYDPSLSKIFFDEMKIRKPDAVFRIKSDTLGTFLGNLFVEIEKEFDEFPPEALVILGDTNSSLAGIIAKRRGIPVYHLEAGNRSFDANVPEEINRKIVDHFSDFNLAYTTHAKENLIREGLPPRNVIVIGSPLCEVISNYKKQIESSDILAKLKIKANEYFLVSAHRQENIDDALRMSQLIDGLNGVAEKYNLPIIVSTHPRMRSKLDSQSIEIHPAIKFHEPFGFFDYNKLQKEARIVLSDSGSVSEESVILGFPAITIRDSLERPEALEAGSIILSGITRKGILEAITILENSAPSQRAPQEYLIPDSSTRVLRFIASTVHQHNFWSGLRSK